MVTDLLVVERILYTFYDVIEFKLYVGQMSGQVAFLFVAGTLCSLLPLRWLF